MLKPLYFRNFKIDYLDNEKVIFLFGKKQNLGNEYFDLVPSSKNTTYQGEQKTFNNNRRYPKSIWYFYTPTYQATK